eukprot:Em0003g725a
MTCTRDQAVLVTEGKVADRVQEDTSTHLDGEIKEEGANDVETVGEGPSNSEHQDGVDQGPSDGVDEGPSDGVDERPSDGVDDGSGDGVDEGPSDGVDEGPSDGVDDESSDGVDEGPSDGVDDGSNDGVDEGPSDGVDEGPSDGVDDESSDGVDEGPSDGVDEGPSGGVDEGVNEGPSDGVDERPSDGVDEGPSDGVDEGPSDGEDQENDDHDPHPDHIEDNDDDENTASIFCVCETHYDPSRYGNITSMQHIKACDEQFFFVAMDGKHLNEVQKAFIEVMEELETNSTHPCNPSQLIISAKYLKEFTTSMVKRSVCCSKVTSEKSSWTVMTISAKGQCGDKSLMEILNNWIDSFLATIEGPQIYCERCNSKLTVQESEVVFPSVLILHCSRVSDHIRARKLQNREMMPRFRAQMAYELSEGTLYPLQTFKKGIDNPEMNLGGIYQLDKDTDASLPDGSNKEDDDTSVDSDSSSVDDTDLAAGAILVPDFKNNPDLDDIFATPWGKEHYLKYFPRQTRPSDRYYAIMMS